MANARGNILQRIVRLVFDRTAARKAEGDQKRTVGTMERGFGTLKKAALAAGAAFASAFAFRELIRGVKETVREFIEADKVWNRLAGTLETIGIGFGGVEGQIRAAARAMQDTTTIGDEEFADILQQLVIISGDYEQSLRNVAVVADVAAGAQIDVSTAADLVGRAMVGETGTLKRYGIIVQEGADAVETMREQFKGLAENESRTLGGQIKQLGNEWDDFKQAMGEAFINAADGTSTIDDLTASVKALTEWVERHGDSLRAFFDFSKFHEDMLRTERNWIRLRMVVEGASWDVEALRILRARLAEINEELKQFEDGVERINLPPETDIAGDILRLEGNRGRDRGGADGPTLDEIEKARQREIDLLVEGAARRKLTVDEEARLLQIEQELRAELARGIPDLERRLRVAKELAAVAAQANLLRARTSPTPGLTGDSIERGDMGIIGLPPADLARFDEHQARHEEWANALLDDLARIQQAQVLTWGIAGNAIGNFFQAAVSGSEGIGEALVGNLLAGFASYLDALATAEFAKALVPFSASGAHIAAGIALKAAAGVVRGLEGRLTASGHGGGGASVSAGGAGLQRSGSPLTQPPTDITLILQGDFDVLNPKFVRGIRTALDEGSETIGPGRVRLQTTSRR